MWPNSHLNVIRLASEYAGFGVWDICNHGCLGNMRKSIASNARAAAAAFLRDAGMMYPDIADVLGLSITVCKDYCLPETRARSKYAYAAIEKGMKKLSRDNAGSKK